MPGWTFLTHHGHVLCKLAEQTDSRIETIAKDVGITERQTINILSDLVTGGYVTKTKQGRNNHYQVNMAAKLRHKTNQNHTVGDLVQQLAELG